MPGGRSLYNHMAVSCQLCVSPGGLVRIFVDARGGLCDCVAVRCQLLYSSGGFVKVFTDARGRSGAVRCQLCSPGGSVSCSQMPEGGLLIVWQLGASSCSSGGS
jgi:hypothetical protein